jgi:hypothetical protein
LLRCCLVKFTDVSEALAASIIREPEMLPRMEMAVKIPDSRLDGGPTHGDLSVEGIYAHSERIRYEIYENFFT